MKTLWSKYKTPFLVVLATALVMFGAASCVWTALHPNKDSRNKMVRRERVEESVTTNERPIAKEVSRNSEWRDIIKGTGMNVSLITYDGRQYIVVYSTTGSGMTMVEHKGP